MKVTTAQATVIGELMISYGYNPAGRGGRNVSASFKARQALMVLGWTQGDANNGVNNAIKLVREEAAQESPNALELVLGAGE